MDDRPKAPTSKLLDLIKTGKAQEEDKAKESDKPSNNIRREEKVKLQHSQKKEELKIEKQDNLSMSGNYYKVPNIIDDVIVSSLSPTEEIIYRHIIRLSWGWNRNWCKVGTHYFQEKSSLKSRKAIRDAINRLLDRQLIKYNIINGKIERDQGGTVYIVPLPSGSSMLLNSALDDSIPDRTNQREQKQVAILPNSILQDRTLANDPIKNIFKNNIKDTLSLDIIDLFYKSIGQTKVAKRKREKAENNIKELMEDGFSQEDIIFAINWTIENAKEKPYDFALIKDTIGQAMSAKREIEIQEQKIAERDQKRAKQMEEEKRFEEEREKIESYKESLSPEQRAELRERAFDEILNDYRLKVE